MTGPEDLRIGDAERTRVTEALHDHFAQGRLTQDELEERLDAALAARTYGDLRRITHDLPMPQATAGDRQAARPPWRRSRPPVFALFALAFLLVALVAGGPWYALVGVLKVILLVWLVTAVLGILRIRRWVRRGGGWGPPRGGPEFWGGPRWSGPYRHGPYGPYHWMGRGPWARGPWGGR
ncbi:MAG TPA: DUF1707 domain-containing protein [Streptosporangiaceae bacterium]|jgi:hypothetical protein